MADKYVIISATKKHEAVIKQIYKECKSELGSFNLYQCWDKYLTNDSNERFHVITTWSVIVIGFVRWNFSKKYGSYVVKDVGVLKEFRGKGVGKDLLQYVPTPVMLKCNEDNEDGNNFYESMGMVKAGMTATKAGKAQVIWTKSEW